jgi:mercuric ion binding protein
MLFTAASVAAHAATDAARTIRMEVNGLVCGFCAHGIKKALAEYAAATEVYVNLERKLVAVALAPGQDIADADLTEALNDAGYSIVKIERGAATLASIRAASEAESDE